MFGDSELVTCVVGGDEDHASPTVTAPVGGTRQPRT